MFKGKIYDFIFALVISCFFAFALGASVTLLRDRQRFNEMVDIQKNILEAVGLYHPQKKKLKKKQIVSLFNQYMIEKKIDPPQGVDQENLQKYIIECLHGKAGKEKKLKIYYKRISPGADDFDTIVVPICGKGLWSTIYGYIALNRDLNTVKGITFYKHGETPGLGGEIEKEWFKKNFIGKKIYNEKGELVSVAVIKGKADPKDPHRVDGISGATFTSKGVSRFLKNNLLLFDKYFKSIKLKAKEQEGESDGN